jgi:tRNA A37 N6-isopentenylltransferase MiaA
MSRTLSSREKILATIVAAVVLIGGTYLLLESYASKRSALQAKIASGKKQLRSLHDMVSQSALWEQREQWLQAKQPHMENADTAGVQLLDEVRELARRHSVLLENPTIRTPDHRPECIAVALEIETKSPWSPLVEFLQELQTPEKFVALESANLKVDPADATQVHGRFKIARWYAPH